MWPKIQRTSFCCFHGFPRTSPDFPGIPPRTYMNFHGLLTDSLLICHALHGLPMDFHGFPWISPKKSMDLWDFLQNYKNFSYITLNHQISPILLRFLKTLFSPDSLHIFLFFASPWNLVAQHCDPPYRAIGYSYTYRHVCFSGYRSVLRYTPLLGAVKCDYVDVLKARWGDIAGQGGPLRYRAL